MFKLRKANSSLCLATAPTYTSKVAFRGQMFGIRPLTATIYGTSAYDFWCKAACVYGLQLSARVVNHAVPRLAGLKPSTLSHGPLRVRSLPLGLEGVLAVGLHGVEPFVRASDRVRAFASIDLIEGSIFRNDIVVSRVTTLTVASLSCRHGNG